MRQYLINFSDVYTRGARRGEHHNGINESWSPCSSRFHKEYSQIPGYRSLRENRACNEVYDECNHGGE